MSSMDHTHFPPQHCLQRLVPLLLQTLLEPKALQALDLILQEIQDSPPYLASLLHLHDPIVSAYRYILPPESDVPSGVCIVCVEDPFATAVKYLDSHTNVTDRKCKTWEFQSRSNLLLYPLRPLRLRSYFFSQQSRREFRVFVANLLRACKENLPPSRF